MKHQKGISQIAVIVIMLILAIALPITTNLVKKSQENRSKAADSCSQWNTAESCYIHSGDGCVMKSNGAFFGGCVSTTAGPVSVTCYKVGNCSKAITVSGTSCNGSDDNYPSPAGCSGAGGNSGGSTITCYKTDNCSKAITVSGTSCNASSGYYPTQAGCSGGGGNSGGSTSGGNPGRCITYSSPTTKDLTTTKSISDLCDAFYGTNPSWPNVTKSGNTFTWTCYGENGGASPTCTASSSTGTGSAPVGTNPTGTIPTTGTCTPAKDAECGTANGGTPMDHFPTTMAEVCASAHDTPESAVDRVGTDGTYNWDCVPCSGFKTAHCSVNRLMPTVKPTTTPTGDGTINLKMAFAGVKPRNDQCATNWPVVIRVVDKDGSTALINNFSGVPTKTSEVNSKGEIIYSFTGNLTNVPSAGVSEMSAFLTGPKHLSIKYGVDKQTSWYKTLAGKLTVKTGTNNYDFYEYPLLAGDVTGDKDGVPDGKIDGRDFSYVKGRSQPITSGPEGTSLAGDLDGNCQVNSGDVDLIKQALVEVNGQTY